MKAYNKTIAKVDFVVSLIWYISALVAFLNSDTLIGYVHLLLGSLWLFIGALYLNKYKKENQK